jgi:hypothetical protein
MNHLLLRIIPLLTLPTLSLQAKQPAYVSPSFSKNTQPKVLQRHEIQALGNVARGVEMMLRQTQFEGTRVWPHAVRDSQGRTGLIVMAHRPLLMSMNMEDIDIRRTWVLVCLIAAARQMQTTESQLDHIALTDREGMTGDPWYYDVDMQVAHRIYMQLNEGSINGEQAYQQVINTWKLVTKDNSMASR